jgi:hypothetical protein
MTLARRKDWEMRLTEFVVLRMRTPFEWGYHDCVTFAADAVQSMTDEELLPFAPAWATARQAYRVLRGYCGLENAVRSVGLEEISPRLARRGDLLMVRGPRRDRPDSMRGALGSAWASASPRRARTDW